MKYIFRILRWPLAQLIIFIDWVTRPTPIERSVEVQADIDKETQSMALYHFQQCPFCVKTRRNIRRLNLNIEKRDARNDPKWNTELVNEGGKYQVPCLRIVKQNGDVQWMYESSEITNYLEKRFAQN